MLQCLPFSVKDHPDWIGYAHALIARQRDILQEEEAEIRTLAAERKQPAQPELDWPPDSREPRDSTERDKEVVADHAQGDATATVAAIKRRSRRPLSLARLLMLLRLASVFGSADAFEKHLRAHPVTVLRGFATGDVSDVVRIIGDLMVPEQWECLSRADFQSYAPPAFVLLHPEVRHDKIEPASLVTYAERIAEVMDTGLPLMLLIPDDVILPEELRPILPEPITLALLSPAILLLALDTCYPDAGVLTDRSLADRLPADQAIARLTPLALRLAFAAQGIEEAITRLAQAAPKAEASVPHLDRIADDNPALPAARRIVADLRDWQAGEVAWSELTRSLLLYGPPGTGKTWLAQAMAASAGIGHVSGSFAEWQAAGHLGHMLDAMRKTFARAFAAAPAILTIDEIDAVGSRSDSDDHARNYRVQVVNAFLEQMDAISRKEGLIVIGTCNNPQRIDPAILRAGRFDLHIEVGRPGPDALAQILRGKLGDGFDPGGIADLARAASGCTPAQIDAAVRMARSLCRAERRNLRLDDIRIALALPPQHDGLDWRIALHEAGHAVVCSALKLGEITRITLTPQGGEIARKLPHHQTLLADMEDEIAYTLAGRAAERLVLGDASAGAGGGEESDLAIATRIAIMIETHFGLGSQGPIWSGTQEIGRLDAATQKLVRARLRDSEVRAATILRQHQAQLIAMAQELQQKRHLSSDDLRRHDLGGRGTEFAHMPQERRAAAPPLVEGPVAEPDSD
ncbi:ATP-dependent Zn proteases [Paracoccus alcaliphilus]|uniref:ATP-dependent Zn proteases n=2 Tax=Paracoccus alcaliphilus TaxID=34002 RepID=A0A1H8NE77_9RHOB|nr:ATP-dependent Zn proteases [Paracoccus alcaliphilus]